MAGLFKTQEEVREFIETIGIEYKFSCLSENDPEGCFLLGQWYEQEKEDYKKAAEVYKKGCDELNYAKCCDRIGYFNFYGKAIPKDKAKATEYWLKGCYDAKGAFPRDPVLACYHGGQVLIGSDPEAVEIVKPDPKKGLDMLAKACKLHLPEACTVLNQLYINGSKYVPKDMAKAAEWGQIGCDYANYECCHNIYLMYKNGDGVAKDLKKASKIREKMKEIEFQKNNTIQFSQYTD